MQKSNWPRIKPSRLKELEAIEQGVKNTISLLENNIEGFTQQYEALLRSKNIDPKTGQSGHVKLEISIEENNRMVHQKSTIEAFFLCRNELNQILNNQNQHNASNTENQPGQAKKFKLGINPRNAGPSTNKAE